MGAAPLPTGVYLGAARRRWRFSRVLLTETTYETSARLKLHAHEHAHLCIVLDGRYEETVGRRRTDVRTPGMALYLPAGWAHAERHRSPGRHVILELLPELADGADEPLNLPSEPTRVFELSTVALRLHHELVDPDGTSALALEGLALEAVAASCRPRSQRAGARPRWLDAVDDVLDARYVNPPTIAQLGAMIGVHPTHLARAYPRATGERLAEAVRRRRLEASARLLLTTDLALSDIALACGFCDQSHFTRLFGRTFGMTPTRFRQGQTHGCRANPVP